MEFLKVLCVLCYINLYAHTSIKIRFNAKKNLAQKQFQTVALHAKIAPLPITLMGPVLKKPL